MLNIVQDLISRVKDITLKDIARYLIVALALIYLAAIPFGKINKDNRYTNIDLGVLAILLIANSDIFNRLKTLKLNKDAVDFEFNELQAEVKNLKSSFKGLMLQNEADIQALREVDLQLSETTPLKAISAKSIKDMILKASPFALEIIYQKAKEVRHCAWKTQKKGLIERTIPIFQALIESEYGKERHRFHAQLGYALKDQAKHDWKKAKEHLETAIELWQQENPSDRLSPYYCFNWICCAVEVENLANFHRRSSQELKDKILARIKSVTDCKTLTEALRQYEAIHSWLDRNQIDKSMLFQVNSTGVCPKEHYLEPDANSGASSPEEKVASMR